MIYCNILGYKFNSNSFTFSPGRVEVFLSAVIVMIMRSDTDTAAFADVSCDPSWGLRYTQRETPVSGVRNKEERRDEVDSYFG